MVVIRESPIFAKDDCLVFPPVNHENLQLASSVSSEFDSRYLESPSESESPSSSSRGSASSFSFPSDSDGQPPPPLSPCEFYHQKLPSETTEGKCESSDLDGQSPPPLIGYKRGGGESSPPPPRKVSNREADDVLQHWWELLLVRAFSKFKNLMTWLSTALRPFYPVLAVAVWWWMRVRARRSDRIQGAIKERDERIVKLLHQIAQMNELLIKHHKEIVSRR
ncbi:Transmembrane protein [Hirschfeldia incana]|nr:Transmembrane protein [Hirschfeldia incana]